MIDLALIGKEIGRTPKHVKYHLDKLAKIDLVEIVDIRSSYGGRVQEKIFRSKKGPWPFMDAEQWKVTSEDEQIDITVQTVGLVSEDVTEAMLSNSLNWSQGADAGEYKPNHISRTPFALDRQVNTFSKQLFRVAGGLLNQPVSAPFCVGEAIAAPALSLFGPSCNLAEPLLEIHRKEGE